MIYTFSNLDMCAAGPTQLLGLNRSQRIICTQPIRGGAHTRPNQICVFKARVEVFSSLSIGSTPTFFPDLRVSNTVVRSRVLTPLLPPIVSLLVAANGRVELRRGRIPAKGGGGEVRGLIKHMTSGRKHKASRQGSK